MSEIQLSRRTLLGGIAAASVASSALAASAPDARWSEAGLDAFRAQAKALGVRALVVISDGRTLVSDGDIAQPFRIASCRKSFLSTLYGLARPNGKVDLDATLEKLGIDDYQPLTPVEKSATLRNLLQARSGVYIPSAAETPAMKAARPPRGSHAPGTFWYYNNWDFNALGEIYQRVTGRNVFTAFEHELAGPLGFQDFDPMKNARWDYDRLTHASRLTICGSPRATWRSSVSSSSSRGSGTARYSCRPTGSAKARPLGRRPIIRA